MSSEMSSDLRVKWTPEQIEMMKEMRGAGQTAREIGKVFAVSRSAVLGKRSRLGLACPPKLINRKKAISCPRVGRERAIEKDQCPQS
jgi:hypothetical protein